MPDPTITDNPDIPEEAVFDGVTAFDRRLLAHDTDIEEFEQHMGPSAAEVVRDVLAAALPHLADQPATTGDQDEVVARLRRRLEVTERSLGAMEKMKDRILRALGWPEHMLDPEPSDVLAGIARLRQSADRDTETAAPADEFAGFYITNHDGYHSLTYYPHEEEDGQFVRSVEAGDSLDELVKAARDRAASLRGRE